MKITSFVLLMIAAILTGCASGKPYAELSKSLHTTAPGKSKIIFFRDSLLGFAVQPDILINGRPVGKSTPGGFFACSMKPGRYTITSKTESTATAIVNIVSGQTAYIRSGITIGVIVGRPTLAQVSTETAKTYLKDLKQAESSC